MGETLVVVESPAKAKTVERYLGKGYTVVASVGHLKDLPKNELGVDVAHDFQPQYVPIKGKAKVLKEIRDLAKKSEQILLASDPDREGEAIAWHIKEEVERYNKTVQRILIHEITQRGVSQALANPLPLNQRLYESQQARRILDRLVGYQISPLLWDKVRRGLSAGRVQSVAVRLVVDREGEIQRFVPEEYWSVVAELATAGRKRFKARLFRRQGKKVRVGSQVAAAEIRQALAGAQWTVAEVEAKEQRKSPPPPFTTAKLQQEAARLLRFSAKRTMALAQGLYQGVELGSEGPVGLITYMRTDSTRLSEDALAMAREAIGQRYGGEYLPDKPRQFRTKKGAQDAHEAIRPSSAERTPDSLEPFLERDQLKLYRLIYNRFLASQMAEAVYQKTQVGVQAGDLEFRAQGQVLVFAGYTRIYGETTEADDREGKDGDEDRAELPRLTVGEALVLEQLHTDQSFTQPPPRFTEATIVKELEERGIGRPSTYAAIISNIQERGYVKKAEGRFHPTELGTLVTDLLVKAFPEILDVEFTAQMETRLDQIEDGEADWLKILKDFNDPFASTLQQARDEMRDVKREEIPTAITCDKCGRIMMLRWGKNGSFLACSGYPECKGTKEYERDETGQIQVKEPEVTDEKCPSCGLPMLVKNGKFGRFLACSGYPGCKTTRPISLGVTCPQCGEGQLTEKRTRKGKVFFSCSRYPACEYALWDRPVPEPCPECGHPFLVHKAARTRGSSKSPEGIACPREGCGFSREP
ncbi:MAG: type I DNA topoisomerase [Myxococcota bacterium]|jgi:DNA topoisomerase-1|nr:type I DNA topoisomerase [Myxococcota bacterium]